MRVPPRAPQGPGGSPEDSSGDLAVGARIAKGWALRFKTKHTPGVQRVFIKIFRTAVGGPPLWEARCPAPRGPSPLPEQPLGEALLAAGPWGSVDHAAGPSGGVDHAAGWAPAQRCQTGCWPSRSLRVAGPASGAAVKPKQLKRAGPMRRPCRETVTIMNDILNRTPHWLGELGPKGRLWGRSSAGSAAPRWCPFPASRSPAWPLATCPQAPPHGHLRRPDLAQSPPSRSTAPTPGGLAAPLGKAP